MKPVDYTKAIQLELFSEGKELPGSESPKRFDDNSARVVDLSMWRKRNAHISDSSATEKVLALLAL